MKMGFSRSLLLLFPVLMGVFLGNPPHFLRRGEERQHLDCFLQKVLKL